MLLECSVEVEIGMVVLLFTIPLRTGWVLKFLLFPGPAPKNIVLLLSVLSSKFVGDLVNTRFISSKRTFVFGELTVHLLLSESGESRAPFVSALAEWYPTLED